MFGMLERYCGRKQMNKILIGRNKWKTGFWILWIISIISIIILGIMTNLFLFEKQFYKTQSTMLCNNFNTLADVTNKESSIIENQFNITLQRITKYNKCPIPK